MAIVYSKRDWYSEDKVKQIITPQKSTWRSRYDLKDQLRLKETDDLVIRNMRPLDMIPLRDSSDLLHTITSAEHQRPDLIAYNQYGDPRLAWVILAANGYSDFLDFEQGATIVIPSAASLFGTGGVMMKW